VDAGSEGVSRALWPPILGLFDSIVVTLTYLRRNRVQAELAEAFGVSQSTISRAVTALTPMLGRMLASYVPVAEDLDSRTQYIVDGTLLPCWSWHGQRQLYSGKHKTTGLNVQVACDLYGRLAWISDPADGCRHDSAALACSGVVDTLDPGNWIGDKGYVGNDMITPIKKPPYRDLLDWEKEFNTAVNKIRYLIEQAIANLKT
jgi:DDE superfamily endonuclease